jgi:hypothetical protein
MIWYAFCSCALLLLLTAGPAFFLCEIVISNNVQDLCTLIMNWIWPHTPILFDSISCELKFNSTFSNILAIFFFATWTGERMLKKKQILYIRTLLLIFTNTRWSLICWSIPTYVVLYFLCPALSTNSRLWLITYHSEKSATVKLFTKHHDMLGGTTIFLNCILNGDLL